MKFYYKEELRLFTPGSGHTSNILRPEYTDDDDNTKLESVSVTGLLRKQMPTITFSLSFFVAFIWPFGNTDISKTKYNKFPFTLYT